MKLIFFLLLATASHAAPTPTKTTTPRPSATATPRASATVTATATPTRTPSPVMPNGFENPVFKLGDRIIFTKSYSISFAGDEAKIVSYDYMTGLYIVDLAKNNVKFSVPSLAVPTNVTAKP